MKQKMRCICVNYCFYWSGRPGSNRRHSAWEADVLPLNYSRSYFFNNLRNTFGHVAHVVVLYSK